MERNMWSLFTEDLAKGKVHRIAAVKTGDNFWRLYDLDVPHEGNTINAACVGSKLTEAEAKAAERLAKVDPKTFADEWL